MPDSVHYKATDEEQAPALQKAPVLDRFIAKFIDLLIMGAFFAFPTAVGPLAGTAYILISDGLKGGQSLGKKAIGLKTISIPTGQPCDFKQSIIRNAVFGVLIAIYFLLGWIPYVGKAAVFLAWAAVTAIEMILVYADESGARFGDRIAGTAVIDARGRF
ncbi:MAG: RDD family protein [Deltaproteobacteria bacterium]|nr:RDD family protein [Deltaproteobacteria bacterium]